MGNYKLGCDGCKARVEQDGLSLYVGPQGNVLICPTCVQQNYQTKAYAPYVEEVAASLQTLNPIMAAALAPFLSTKVEGK